MKHLVSAFLSLCALSAMAAPSLPGDWLELIDTTRLAHLRDSKTLQVSSYDRTGGNDDGFSGNHSFLRQEGDAYVIFEDEGPGCVYRIWSANPGARRIEFYFDGETTPRLAFDNWEEMFQGKVEPFLPPVSVHEIGGWTSYVPMPYAKSLKIVTRERINFYQVTYQKFAPGTEVKTFTTALDADARAKFERVCKAWNNLGAHPWAEAIEETKHTDTVVAAGATESVVHLKGTGIAHELIIEADAVAAKPALLRQVRVRITAGKGAAQVDVPLGDFFLQNFPGGHSQSLLAGVDGKTGTRFYSYWPMPYAKGLTLELINESSMDVPVRVAVGYAKQRHLSDDIAYFHAKWLRQNPTTPGELFPILDAKGRGHWCGISMAMQGFGPGMGYLEGDELLWIDDRDNSQWNGTGSEDYYNGGWYFGKTGNLPFFGCGYHADPEGRVHAFRLHMTDLVPFQQQARIGIEHGHGNEVSADYSGTTFWYATPDTVTNVAAMPPVRDRVWTSLSKSGYAEAETAMVAGESAGEIIDDYEQNVVFSAGRAIQSEQHPKIVKLDVEVKDDDIYELFLLAAGGRTHLTIPSTKLETDVMLPRLRDGVGPVSLGEMRLAPGKHRLELASWEGPMIVDAYQLKASMKTPGAVEAERILGAGAGGAEAARIDFTQRRASGDAYASVRGAKGGSASFIWNAEWNTRYAISVRLQRAPGNGRVRFALDGKPFGEPFECYAEEEEWIPAYMIGVTDRLSVGEHTLTATIDGVPPSGTGALAIDYFLIAPDGLYEGERARVVEAKGSSPTVQDMNAFGKQWSSNGQVWFTPQNADAALTLELEMPYAEERTVCAYFTKAADYGRYQVLVNGTPIGEPFDGYAPGVERSERIVFGKYAFKTGKHQITFQCVGKHEKSSSFMLGLDLIVLE